MEQYKTVEAAGMDEFTEKRSRFIGYCRPVGTQEQALAFLEEKRREHWDAAHNVYAYVLRGGFRDGWHGLVYAYVRANYVRQKTIMLWLLQNGQPLTDPPRDQPGA